ncbi:hypothetical protein H5T55_06905 [Candidatus Bipolaricaulota bacterium]|nr:hypothetical protein [Candidatus Bipolaricaulota bacterium]
MRGRTKHNLVRTALGLGLLATGIALGGCELFWLTAPAVPTGIEASDGTHAGQVVVIWNGVARTVRYEVYRADTQGGTYTQLGETTGTVYSDATVIPNTTYWYRVKACNRSGCSELSEPDSGYAHGEGVPEVPTGVSATDGLYTDRVRVTWNASPGATSYEVWRDVAQGGPYTLRGTVAGTTYDDLDASPGVVYWYKVKACNPSGCSAFSAADSGFTFPSAPDPVTNVSASDGTYTDRVRVTWTAAAGAANYEVYRADSETGTYTRRATVTGTTYDDTGVTVGTTYWYKVKACNTAGCSAFSVPDPGFASAGGGGGGGGGGGTPALPGQPQNVRATDGTDKEKIVVTWSSVTGAARYEVWRSNPGEDAGYTRYGETTTTSFTDTAPTMCQVYWYRVRAGNAAGWGPDSVADSGYRGGTLEQVNTSKIKVTVTPATETTADVKLEWEAVKDATLFNVRYEIWRRGTAGSSTLVHTTTAPDVLTWTDTGRPLETTFYYKIRAVSTYNCIVAGPFSGEIQATIACNPTAPTTVTAAKQSSTSIKVDWSAVPGATGYEVYRATSATGFYTKVAGPLDALTYTNTDLPAGTYYYKVKTCVACGCGGLSAPSNAVTVPTP